METRKIMQEPKNELQLQAQCALWLHNNFPQHRGKFRRVKNETDHFGLSGNQRIAQGVENRATGVVKGTWDAFFMTNPMFWIEFKFGKGVLTLEQKEFREEGIKLGWNFCIVKSLVEFQTICEIILKIK
jgi:hypothetical protein